MNTSAFFRDTKKIIFSLVSLFSIIGYGVFVFAAPPGVGGYNPGEILDPECAPGDVDCVVKLQTSGGGSPAGSDNQIQINQSGSFFADSTFQKSDTGFNLGLDHTAQSPITFTGSGLDDLTPSGTFSGTAPITYTVTIDGVNIELIAIDSSTITGGTFAVADVVTNGLGGTATVNSVVQVEIGDSLEAYTYLGVTVTTGTFGSSETIDNGTGVTGTGSYEVGDTFGFTDGTITYSNTPVLGGVLLSNGIKAEFANSTGHTLSDSWTWTYSYVNQNVLDFSDNDYKFQSTFGTDTFGYQITDNLFGFGIAGSGNTYTNVAGDFGFSGILNSGELTIGNSIQLATGETADSSLKVTRYDLSIRDALGIETQLEVTSNNFYLANNNSSNINGIEFNNSVAGLLQLGNIYGGNGTSITIDDIAQTINFNNNYSFPFADGTAGQVLGTDGSGQLGWVTVSGGGGGGGSSPISVNGTTLYSSGLPGTGDTNGYNVFFGINAGSGATAAAFSNFFGINAGQNATYASNSNFFGRKAGSGVTNASNSNFFGYQAGQQATSAYNSNFFGSSAGYFATNANFSNFFGLSAGYNAAGATNSNFFGYQAGNTATNAYNSNFFGENAGSSATVAYNSNFFGENAGQNATNAAHSNFFGSSAGYDATNASNSIFIGQSAGNSDLVNNTGSPNDFSILIGQNTSTGGYSNSIAIGGSATNTASNQLMIGSATRPIDEIRVVQTGGTECIIDTSGLGCTSDERLKTNIADLTTDTLDKLLNVKTVNYNWLNNPNGKTMTGFLAQDLEQYFPELVATNERGQKSVYYAQMTPILVQAIREMNLHITELSNMERPNTWRDSLIAWFGNVENGITELFVGRAHMRELCIGEQNNETCLTKDQIDQLLQILPTEQYETTNPIIENTPPVGELVNETEIIDTEGELTEENVPESTVLVVETKPEPETEPQVVSENNSADTSEQ